MVLACIRAVLRLERAHPLLCNARLPCGHRCRGVAGERVCLGCMDDACGGGGVGSDLCPVCLVEPLSAAPCFRNAPCGHVLHVECATSKLRHRWPGSRITFGFMQCPVCAADIRHECFEPRLAGLRALRDDVHGRAMLQLQREGVKVPDGVTPLAHAMRTFAFYKCFTCNEPYYGGRVSCDDLGGGGDEDASCRVCPACQLKTLGKSVCAVHGAEFVQFKCRFCCMPATFKCWGTTHFCTSCHTQQERGNYLSCKKVNDLPSCPGVELCPLRVPHPPTGTEFPLGCSLCRSKWI
jgi:RCR-type E3 ubiquitin transferase